MKRTFLYLATTLAIHFSALAETQVPALMNYQGHVTNAAGVAIGTGSSENRSVTFRFWKSATDTAAASRLYSETQTVTILNGDFSVLIGSGAPVEGEANSAASVAAVFANKEVFLGITVDDGNTATTDAEVSPRQQLVSTAFAFRASVAESVDSGAISNTMLAANAVDTNQLKTSAVTLDKLALNSVNSNAIVDGSVTGADIATDTIKAVDIATGGVGSLEILDGTIATADIAAGAVTTAKIATDTILAGNIAAGAVGTSEIADGVVTGTDIAAGTISLSNLVAAVQQSLVPAGTIVAYGGTTAPDGWLLCHGASVSRSTYPSLFTAIGTKFGTASTSFFNVPDFRGRFLRGWDSNTGRDPDRATRTAMASGGSTGDVIGSIQNDAFESHNHTHSFLTAGYTSTYNTAGEVLSNGQNNGSTTRSTNATGGTETRPLNANVNYIIKY
jgi:microcystin-dependent protein